MQYCDTMVTPSTTIILQRFTKNETYLAFKLAFSLILHIHLLFSISNNSCQLSMNLKENSF